MSAPRRPARSSSDRLRAEAAPAQCGRRVGRSAAEPAAVRDPLVDRRGGARSGEVERTGDEVRARRSGPRRRTGRSPSASDRSAVARFERQQVVQFEADHLGVDQVVAVVAHAGDVQRHRQLGVGPPRAHGAAGGRRDGVGQPAPREHVEFLGRAVGATPAAANCSGVTMPSSERRSILRRWPNPARTSGNSVAGSVVGPSVSKKAAARSRRATTRRSVAARTPTPGHCPTMRARGPVRDLHAHRAVRRRARARHESFRRLPLHHHDHPVDLRDAVEQVADERRRHVVRQVGDEHPPRIAGRSPTGSSRAFQSASIASASTTVTLARSATTSRRSGTIPRSTSTAVIVGAGVGQGERQRPEPGADLDHAIARPDPGEIGDAAHGVGVGDEVLPEVAAGGQVVGFEELADRRPGVGHEVMSTGIGASVRSAIWANVSVCSTMPFAPVGVHAVGDAADRCGRCRGSSP